MKMKHSISILLALLILSSCSFSGLFAQETPDRRAEVCMPPVFKGAFPVKNKDETMPPFSYPTDRNQAPESWDEIVKLNHETYAYIELLFTRIIRDEEELVYRIVNHSQRTEKVFTINTESGEISELFHIKPKNRFYIDNDGIVWVLISKTNPENYKDYHELLYFDEQAQKLVPVVDDEGILVSAPIADLDIGPDNDIWVVLSYSYENRQIYRFSPATGKATAYMEPGIYSSIDVDNYNNLYILRYDGFIQRYDSESGQVSEYKIPSYGYALSGGMASFYFAEDDKVWLNDKMWFNNDMDFSDVYYVVRSPIFIGPSPGLMAPYEWMEANLHAETPDGRYWFRSFVGAAWFEPESGEWCMFTTSDSNILKDSEGNLWMTYDNSLYMLPASETKARDD